LPEVYDNSAHVWHIFAVRVAGGKRDEFGKKLADNGVGTQIHYPVAPHKQQAYSEWNNLSYPVTEQICKEIISLPVSPVLTDKEVVKITELVNDFK
jgi:dTDP-4-amino-4,6-dideoxygalactose transaminase